MFKKKPAVEWEFLSEADQNAPWPPAPQDPADQPAPRTRSRLRRAVLFSIAMTVLLTVGIGGAYARQEALKGVETIEQEVQVAVEAEQWVQDNAPQLSADVLVDDGASPFLGWMVEHEQALLRANTHDGASEPVLRIQETRFADGIAAAKLTLTEHAAEGGAPAVFRQTRFYRETEHGWLRTKPDPKLWGAPLTLETDLLVWQYQRRDQAAVTAVAAQIDALYAQLQRDYGLPQSSEDDKLVIDVQADYLPGLVLNSHPDDPIIVPSPAVYLVSMERTDAEILAQAVAFALLKNMWAQVDAQHYMEESWALLSGMNLWELWEMGLGLSEWRDEIVQWSFGDSAQVAADYDIELPALYREFCAAHSTWMISPVSVGIPLYCDNGDSSPMYDLMLTSLHRTNLTGYQNIPSYSARADQILRMGRPLQAYTVIDYAVAAHGRERLADLVAALGQHDTWETLVPAVYGVSIEEFEQGWRQHVAALAQ